MLTFICSWIGPFWLKLPIRGGGTPSLIFVNSVFVSSESLEALWIDLHCLWFMLVLMSTLWKKKPSLLYLFPIIVWTSRIFLWRWSYTEMLKDKQYVWLVELTIALSVLAGFRLLQDVGSCVQWVKRPSSQCTALWEPTNQNQYGTIWFLNWNQTNQIDKKKKKVRM